MRFGKAALAAFMAMGLSAMPASMQEKAVASYAEGAAKRKKGSRFGDDPVHGHIEISASGHGYNPHLAMRHRAKRSDRKARTTHARHHRR